MDCSLPGSSVHGILQPKILEWVACVLFQGTLLTQGSSPDLFHLLLLEGAFHTTITTWEAPTQLSTYIKIDENVHQN